MGSQPREVDQETPSATMVRTVLALALVAVVKSQGDISQRMMRQIAEYNFRSACWGQENMDNSILALIKDRRSACRWSLPLMLRLPSIPKTTPLLPSSNRKIPSSPFLLKTLIASSLCGETRGLLPLLRDSSRQLRLILLTS